jgi:hypothetical protein
VIERQVLRGPTPDAAMAVSLVHASAPGCGDRLTSRTTFLCARGRAYASPSGLGVGPLPLSRAEVAIAWRNRTGLMDGPAAPMLPLCHRLMVVRGRLTATMSGGSSLTTALDRGAARRAALWAPRSWKGRCAGPPAPRGPATQADVRLALILLSFQMLPEQPLPELLDAAALADRLGCTTPAGAPTRSTTRTPGSCSRRSPKRTEWIRLGPCVAAIYARPHLRRPACRHPRRAERGAARGRLRDRQHRNARAVWDRVERQATDRSPAPARPTT